MEHAVFQKTKQNNKKRTDGFRTDFFSLFQNTQLNKARYKFKSGSENRKEGIHLLIKGATKLYSRSMDTQKKNQQPTYSPLWLLVAQAHTTLKRNKIVAIRKPQDV